MDISKIDKNFNLPQLDRTDVTWLNANDSSFSLNGIYYNEQENAYYRMPYGITEGVNWGVGNTAGGRLRFKTNSSFVALKAIIPAFCIMRHMPTVGTAGFSLYVNGKFHAMCVPDTTTVMKYYESSLAGKNTPFAFQGYFSFGNNQEREIEIYFPLYNGVNELYVGIQDGYTATPNPYPTKKRVVFYGSSITQGGCASRPGNDYIGHLSRWLNVDVLNLGFSGSAKGEQSMAKYLASLHEDVYVIDYDHNTPNAEHLQKTHYPFYETIRKENPTAPIVFITKPDTCDDSRIAVILDTYAKAYASGDKNVYFINGKSLFTDEDRDSCTVDGCHPNDLGFYRMAKAVLPVLKECLK